MNLLCTTPALTSMETLRQYESISERATVQELRLIRKNVLDLRSDTDPEVRAYADGLQIKLEHLMKVQVADADNPADILLPMPLHMQHHQPAFSNQSDALGSPYTVRLFDHETGDLAATLVTDSFLGAVDLAQERLPAAVDYRSESSWIDQQGRMEVYTMTGVLMAQIEPSRIEQPHLQAASTEGFEDNTPVAPGVTDLPQAA